jgi:hypothetical protein
MKQIYRVRYRVGKDASHEIIAIEKICQKRMSDLVKKHGKNVKFSKMVPATTHPRGAPHI